MDNDSKVEANYSVKHDSVIITSDAMNREFPDRKMVYITECVEDTLNNDAEFTTFTIQSRTNENINAETNTGHEFIGYLTPKTGLYPLEFDYHQESHKGDDVDIDGKIIWCVVK